MQKKWPAIVLLALIMCGISTVYGEPLTLSIDNVEYTYRWSKGNQHEFTPQGQEELSTWEDMLTINMFPEVSGGEDLALIANNVLSIYQRSGKVLRTNSIPRTATSEAEHLIVAVLGNPKLLEVVFTRVKMIEGKGSAIVWSHRIYGEDSGNAMSVWLQDNGSVRETKLMAFQSFPKIDSIGK